MCDTSMCVVIKTLDTSLCKNQHLSWKVNSIILYRHCY